MLTSDSSAKCHRRSSGCCGGYVHSKDWKLLPLIPDVRIYKELIQTEERYHEIKDALKTLNKLDFDKLISSVRHSTT